MEAHGGRLLYRGVVGSLGLDTWGEAWPVPGTTVQGLPQAWPLFCIVWLFQLGLGVRRAGGYSDNPIRKELITSPPGVCVHKARPPVG